MQPAEHEAQTQERPERLQVLGVPVAALETIWPRVLSFLEPLLEKYRLETVDDVLGSIADGSRELWILVRGEKIAGTVVTQVVQFPRHRVFEVVFLAGVDVVDEMGVFAQWSDRVARESGCTILQCYGRKGWAKPFKQLGATQEAIVYRVELA